MPVPESRHLSCFLLQARKRHDFSGNVLPDKQAEAFIRHLQEIPAGIDETASPLRIIRHAGHEFIIRRLCRVLFMREERAQRDKELTLAMIAILMTIMSCFVPSSPDTGVEPLDLDIPADIAAAHLSEVFASRQYGIIVMQQPPAKFQKIPQ